MALGASIGPCRRTLALAVRAIDALPMTHVRRCSRAVYSVPMGGSAHRGFFNAVLRIETSLELSVLFDALQALEPRLGRHASLRWGDRAIDLDLLLVDDLRHADARLTLPHPEIARRAFVWFPALEVGADLLARVGFVAPNAGLVPPSIVGCLGGLRVPRYEGGSEAPHEDLSRYRQPRSHP